MPISISSDSFYMDEEGVAKIKKPFGGTFPKREEISAFANCFRKWITSLSIDSFLSTTKPFLDFEALGVLPNLKTLKMSYLSLKRVRVTVHNTPALESLCLEYLDSPDKNSVELDLNLPKLRFLNMDHVNVTEETDFGLCVSRCPNLEEIKALQLRFHKGPNIMILPKCRKLSLEMCELIENVEIVQAPYLEEFSINFSTDMKHVRIWDVPYAMEAGDVQQLKKEYQKALCEKETELWKEKKKWVEQEYDGVDAYNKGWIEEYDIEIFNQLFLRLFCSTIVKRLEAEVERKQEKSRIDGLVKLISKVSHRRKIHAKRSLPTCKVRNKMTWLDESCYRHLEFIERVKVDYVGARFLNRDFYSMDDAITASEDSYY